MFKLTRLVKRTKRVGRGYGSGKGGHTIGKGQKGQKVRGKGKPGIGFEGGKTPIYKKIPIRRGYENKPVSEYTEITITTLLRALKKSTKKYKVITPRILEKLGFKPAKDGFKIIGKLDKSVEKLSLQFRGVKLSKGVAEAFGIGSISKKE